MVDYFDEKLNKIIQIPQTQSMHSVQVVSEYVIVYSKYTQLKESNYHHFKADFPVNNEIDQHPITTGDFVVIEYRLSTARTRKFLGEVTNIKRDRLNVSFLRKKSQRVFFYHKNDSDFVNKDLVC